MFLPSPVEGFSFPFSPASHEAGSSFGDIATFFIISKLYAPMRQLMVKFLDGGYNDEAAQLAVLSGARHEPRGNKRAP